MAVTLPTRTEMRATCSKTGGPAVEVHRNLPSSAASPPVTHVAIIGSPDPG
jgi:hypothetical protein